MAPPLTSPLVAADELLPIKRLVLRALRRWRVGLVGALVVLAVAELGFAVWPKRWVSEAVVNYQEGLQWTAGEGGAGGRRVGQRLKDTLLARAQLGKIIEELKLYPELSGDGRLGEAIEEMRAATTFRIAEGDVYVISYTGGSAAGAQRVTARLVEVLASENQRARAEQAEVARDFLDSERKRIETQLAQREAAQLNFLAAYPEFAHDEAVRSGVLRSAAWRAPEVEVRMPEAEDPSFLALAREEERLRRQLATPGPRPPQDPALVAARNEADAALRIAQRELAERRAAFTEQHPDVTAAESKVEVAAKAYQRAASAVDAAAPALLQERLAEVQRELKTYRRPAARVRVGTPFPTGATAQRVVSQEAEWARLSREAAESRERYRELEARQFMAVMTANLASAGQGSRVVIIDPPSLPATPLGPGPIRFLALALLMALAAGVVAALAAAVADDLIHERYDVERLDVAPLLVEVPEATGPGADGEVGGEAAPSLAAPDGPLAEATTPAPSIGPGVEVRLVAGAPPLDPRLVVLAAPGSPAAAAYRMLRHRLVERGGVRTIAVTSPNAGEGKTLCAANLALALCESGRARVLLLEANLRSPALARLLGFQPPSCMAAQLERSGQDGAPWVVVEHLVPWLHIAAVAPDAPARPHLEGPAIHKALEDLRRAGYDYVVVDGPPILGSADANVLEEVVDGLLLTVRAHRSSARALRAGVEQLGSRRMLGVALLEG